MRFRKADIGYWLVVLAVCVFVAFSAVLIWDNIEARRDATASLKDSRERSTNRINGLFKELEAERAEGDKAEERAARYLQQLDEHGITPFDNKGNQ